MKNLVLINASILIIGIITMILQLWFSIFEADTFTKVIFTEGGILAISLIVSFVYKELKDNKRFKNGGDLDF